MPRQTRTRPVTAVQARAYVSKAEVLRTAGPDGTAAAKELARLLPMKTRAEYEPDDIPKSDAAKAVERARRIVEVARRLLGAQRS